MKKCRHGGTQAEDQQRKDGEHDLLAQLRDLPRVAYCFDHLDHLILSASRDDLLLRGSGEGGSLDMQLLGQIAVAQDLDAVLALGEDTLLQQSLGVDHSPVLELLQSVLFTPLSVIRFAG